MCGIIGFTGKQNHKKLSVLLDQIKHRGYDEKTTAFYANVNIGMNRLAIKDPTKNLYPFVYKHYSLVYNGEIYNYKSIKKDLKKKGISFKTNSDAEIILPLFDQFGFKSFSMLEGMFAISIIDQKNNQIILSRDKSGEKPLYYHLNKKEFIFSSEIKSIISFENKKLNLDISSLQKYLRHGSISGNKTLVKNIKKIPPASYLIHKISTTNTTVKKYWKIKQNACALKNKKTNNNSIKTQIKKLDKLISTSIKKRLMSDMPLGCFISGGVDSSLIATITSNHINKLKTYSVSFPGFSHDDESFHSRKIASLINSDHTEIKFTANHAREILEKIGSIIDEPIVDPATLPTYLMTKIARKNIKVALTGEGADELFAGYHRYQKHLVFKQASSLIKHIPFIKEIRNRLFPHRLNRVFRDLSKVYSPQNVWQNKELFYLLNKNKIKNDLNIISSKNFEIDPLYSMQATDFKSYLSEQLLMKVDKMSMQNNLEVRAPFLDTDIINFAFNLPFKQKIKGPFSKYLLRKVASKHLPSDIVWRVKHGFSVPLNEWFRNELKDMVFDSINDIKKYPNLFDEKYYSHIIKEHMENKQNHRDKIWSIIALTKWLNNYKNIKV